MRMSKLTKTYPSKMTICLCKHLLLEVYFEESLSAISKGNPFF